MKFAILSIFLKNETDKLIAHVDRLLDDCKSQEADRQQAAETLSDHKEASSPAPDDLPDLDKNSLCERK